MFRHGEFKKILADNQKANIVVPVVVVIIPVNVQVALVGILVEVEIPELAPYIRGISSSPLSVEYSPDCILFGAFKLANLPRRVSFI